MSRPETVLLSHTGTGVVHDDPGCRTLKSDGRPVPFEYARRAGYRWCRSCGNGEPLDATTAETKVP